MLFNEGIIHNQGDFLSGNYNTVGTVSVSSTGIASGFSTSNYLQTPQLVQLNSANTWEIGMKLTTGASVSGEQDFFGCAMAEGNAVGMLVNNGKWQFSIGYNGRWIYSNVGDNYITAGTTYLIKLQFTGSQYIFSFSTNGTTWVVDKTVSSTQKITNGTYGNIGRSSRWLNRYFQGSIDLSSCYITINGELWWSNAYQENVIGGIPHSIITTVPNYWKYTLWAQPTFTSNTTWGTVSADAYYSGEEPYKALDGNTTSSYYASGNASTINWYWEFEQELRISAIQIYNRGNAQSYGGATTYTFYALIGGNYKEIGQTSVAGTSFATNTLTLSTPVNCTGLKVYCKGSKNSVGIGEIKLTAYTISQGTSTDYDDITYSNNYYYILKPDLTPQPTPPPTGLYLWQSGSLQIYTSTQTPKSDADLRNEDGSVYSFNGTDYPHYYVSGGNVYCYENIHYENTGESVQLTLTT